jgi:hypothetical protein
VIWPFLLCCIVCNCCCKRENKDKFSKCELIWPTIILIIALLLIIAPSILGLVKAKDLQRSYEAVGCSRALTFSDVLNGNISSTGKPFIGLQPFSSALS